jgi:intracellular sulfur oxidation DsrE/DsrF family protein
MASPHTIPLERRGFLVRLTQAAAALGATAMLPRVARAADGHLASDVASLAGPDPDAWIARLPGRHRVMLHIHQNFAGALADARGMQVNARELYGVAERDFGVAVVLHGRAIHGLFGDEAWARFGLGALYEVKDAASGAPAARNPFLVPREGEPAELTVPGLIERGVVFVVCNVALRRLASRVATGGVGADEAHRAIVAGLVPGVHVVPDAFVAMQRAQQRGVAYLMVDRGR